MRQSAELSSKWDRHARRSDALAVAGSIAGLSTRRLSTHAEPNFAQAQIPINFFNNNAAGKAAAQGQSREVRLAHGQGSEHLKSLENPRLEPFNGQIIPHCSAAANMPSPHCSRTALAHSSCSRGCGPSSAYRYGCINITASRADGSACPRDAAWVRDRGNRRHFLLTAIPNQTGRLTIMFSAKLGDVIAGTIDSALLLCLAAVGSREIIAGKNRRNLRVLEIIALLALGRVAFHIEAVVGGSSKLRNANSDRRGKLACFSDRRPRHTKLYWKLAGAEASPAFACPLLAFRCIRDRRQRDRRSRLDCCARPADHRKPADACRSVAVRPPCALGRRSNSRRPARPRPARRLRIRSTWVLDDWPVHFHPQSFHQPSAFTPGLPASSDG